MSLLVKLCVVLVIRVFLGAFVAIADFFGSSVNRHVAFALLWGSMVAASGFVVIRAIWQGEILMTHGGTELIRRKEHPWRFWFLMISFGVIGLGFGAATIADLSAAVSQAFPSFP